MRVAIIIVNIIAIDSMLDIRAARTSNSNSYIAVAKILTDSHLQVVLVSIWQLLSSRVITHNIHSRKYFGSGALGCAAGAALIPQASAVHAAAMMMLLQDFIWG